MAKKREKKIGVGSAVGGDPGERQKAVGNTWEWTLPGGSLADTGINSNGKGPGSANKKEVIQKVKDVMDFLQGAHSDALRRKSREGETV